MAKISIILRWYDATSSFYLQTKYIPPCASKAHACFPRTHIRSERHRQLFSGRQKIHRQRGRSLLFTFRLLTGKRIRGTARHLRQFQLSHRRRNFPTAYFAECDERWGGVTSCLCGRDKKEILSQRRETIRTTLSMFYWKLIRAAKGGEWTFVDIQN